MNVEKFNEEIDKVIKLIRKGYQREYILKKINEKYFSKQKIFEIAKCRIKARKKFGEMASFLFFDEEGLRYSTPPVIAEYRAKRLKSHVIADISCGVGCQLIYFSKYSNRAIGVEIDGNRIKLAKLNMLSLNIENVEIMKGDALDEKIFKKIDATCIFSDPSRKEKEKKKFKNLSPNPLKVYEKYKEKVDRIAFELPPQMEKKEIKLKGEKEYTSLNFSLNRLALYMNELSTCNVSAVSLPSMERITDLDDYMELEKKMKIREYVYEVDYTIVKAGLIENLAGKICFDGNILNINKRCLLSSSSSYSSSFFRKYKVVKICNFEFYELNKILKKLNAKKAIIRFFVEPKNYWKIRNKIEEGLKGENTYYIFKIKNKAIIGSKV